MARKSSQSGRCPFPPRSQGHYRAPKRRHRHLELKFEASKRLPRLPIAWLNKARSVEADTVVVLGPPWEERRGQELTMSHVRRKKERMYTSQCFHKMFTNGLCSVTIWIEIRVSSFKSPVKSRESIWSTSLFVEIRWLASHSVLVCLSVGCGAWVLDSLDWKWRCFFE